MLLLGYIVVTCHKNIFVTLHVIIMLYRRNETCLLGCFVNVTVESCCAPQHCAAFQTEFL